MTNGLTPEEDKKLTRRLRQLDEILTRRCLMGAAKRRRWRMLQGAFASACTRGRLAN